MTSTFPDIASAVSACIEQVTTTHSKAEFVGIFRGMGPVTKDGKSYENVTEACQIRNLRRVFFFAPDDESLSRRCISSLNFNNFDDPAVGNFSAKSEDLGPWEVTSGGPAMIGSGKIAWPPKLNLEEAWAFKDKGGFTDPVIFIGYMGFDDVGFTDEPAYWFATEKSWLYVGATTGRIVEDKTAGRGVQQS